jgi:RHS repeat-associated protein
MGAVRRRIAAVLAAAMTASLLSVVAVPETAYADGPSVPLPQTPSTPVKPEGGMQSRPPDQATQNALRGDQPGGTKPQEGAGTTKATPLSPSATWQVSAQTGDFTWSYPLRVPPAPGGLEPELALSYSSSAVDGRTSATNNQASWIGDGWDLSPGFVERVYGACGEDDMGGTTPPDGADDLCWRSDNAIASYGGSGGELICCDAGGLWRAKGDDGSRIERLQGIGNGDDNGEHWKITSVDGTQYFFGSRPEANSTWTVPVFGDDAEEPCNKPGGFGVSHCVQAWRWNLDKVVDRNGNMITYGYQSETNKYGLNRGAATVTYVRGGTLRTIDYGMRAGQAPAAHVEFTTADRCVPGSTCRPDLKDNWPDVPWAENCAAATCANQHSPSFWSTQRLSTITTQVRRSTGMANVDSWTLGHEFPAPGGEEKATLWLKSIVHTGLVGGSAPLPAVIFEGTRLPNRVYKIDGASALLRYRVTAVVSESGGVTSVNYAAPDCVEGSSMPANAWSNSLRCFPVRWRQGNTVEHTDYFHKYVVRQVTELDRVADNPMKSTTYEYLGGAAWHYDTSEFTKDSKRTWDEFRGFDRVRIRAGAQPDPGDSPVTMTEHRFHRGMNGDRKEPSGGTKAVTVETSEGVRRDDDDWLHGMDVETLTYDGDTDRVVSKVTTQPTPPVQTAARGSRKAYIVRTGATETWTALAAGGWRKTRTESTYDDRGLVLNVNDLADLATAADDRCVRTTYARATGPWLMSLPRRVEEVGVNCAATPSFPGDAISDVRNSYDGGSATATPTAGNLTRVEELTGRPSSGDPVYVTTSVTAYDEHGRPIEAADALGRVTKTAYTPATAGPLTQLVITNPLGHVTTTALEPAWGLPTTVVDPNNRRTESAYDPLGRLVEAWLPSRLRATQGGNAKFSYLIRKDAPSVVTSNRLNANGNYVTTKEVYDGLLRLRQTQTPAPGGGRLLTDTRYDTHGRAYRTTKPYFQDSAMDDNLWNAVDAKVPGQTVIRFDGAGREVAEVFQEGVVDKWRTTTEYGGDRVHVTPPAGATPTTVISDARGQTTELRQYRGSKPSGEFDATTYTYTKAGQLASTKDPAGYTWRYGYDLRGNEIRDDDPDKGLTATTYDAAGQALTVTDARGVTLTTAYDPLGRKRTVKSGDGLLAEWTYDTAIKGKGHPASATRYLDGAAYTRTVASYSELYHPYETRLTVPGSPRTGKLAGTYVTYSKLNVDGSPDGTALPAIGDLPKETVDPEYDDLGNPVRLSGGLDRAGTSDYVTASEFTRYGEVAQLTLGEVGARTWLSYYYDNSTRRLSRSIVDTEAPNPMVTDVNYTYDPAGNVTSIANTPARLPSDTQCFRYDHLRRLTEAWTPGGGCDAAPSTSSLAGAAPYWHSYRYDLVGNRLAETQHAAAGDTVRTYAYPAAGAHQLSSVTAAGPAGSKKDEFTYDAVGNTLTRPGQKLDWDTTGKLAKVTEDGKVTRFVYDADGERLLREDPTGITLYLDGQDLRLTKATGALNGTRYYEHDGQTIATRTAAGVTWEAGDHQDTAQVAVDAASRKVTQRRQTPFGAPRGMPVPWVGDKGFVGGTTDTSTGLTNLGARQYDPLLGRFISVDPVMDLSDAQQMHGYTYSNNNPVTFSDPTGLFWGGLKKAWNTVKNAARIGWNGVKERVGKVVDGVKWVAKHGAPILGFASVALAATPIGALVAGVALGLGMINVVSNCGFKQGSSMDCAMDIAGAVPGVGKLMVGGVRFMGRQLATLPARIVGAEARVARAEARIAADIGSNPAQMLNKPLLGAPGEVVGGVLTVTGGAYWASCDLAKLHPCPGVPAPTTVAPALTQPRYLEDPTTFARKRMYPPGFIGPIPAGSVRAKNKVQYAFGSTSPAPSSPSKPPPGTGQGLPPHWKDPIPWGEVWG